MAPYIHHCIPEIEKYANQLQWVENILEDRDNTEVVLENTLLELENQLDENSFLQVPPQEGIMSTPPIMKTPLNEEKNPKRGMEEGSCSGKKAFNVQYERGQSKRPRLNPVSEHEYIDGSVEITNSEPERSKGTAPSEETKPPSSSFCIILASL